MNHWELRSCWLQLQMRYDSTGLGKGHWKLYCYDLNCWGEHSEQSYRFICEICPLKWNHILYASPLPLSIVGDMASPNPKATYDSFLMCPKPKPPGIVSNRSISRQLLRHEKGIKYDALDGSRKRWVQRLWLRNDKWWECDSIQQASTQQ